VRQAMQIPYIIAGNGGHAVAPLKREPKAGGPPLVSASAAKKDGASRYVTPFRAPTVLQEAGKGKDLIRLENYDDQDFGYLRIVVTPKQLRIEYHPAPDGDAPTTWSRSISRLARSSRRRSETFGSAERRLDVAGELLRLLAGRIAAHRSKLPVDQELGEIPLDRLRAQEAGRFVFERLKKRVGVRAVDFDLGEHRERHVVLVAAKLADCSLVPGLLMAELVARKSEHSEAALAKAPVQRFEARILRGEAALARNIDDQQRLARKVAECARRAVDRLKRNVG
jgi:hypothetical protein